MLGFSLLIHDDKLESVRYRSGSRHMQNGDLGNPLLFHRFLLGYNERPTERPISREARWWKVPLVESQNSASLSQH